MKAFELSIGGVILRFYLMMAIVVVAGFIGQWWLAILALPVLLSTMSGIRFSFKAKKEAKIKTLTEYKNEERKVG